MADITDHHDQGSPSGLDDQVGNGSIESRGIKRQRPATAEDDDDDDEKGNGRERRKIEIKFITDKSRRHITFSKRKAGIMKKVRQPLSCSRSHLLTRAGLRTLRPHRHTSPASRRLGNWSRLHIHNSQAPASGHQGRGQESDPGKCTLHFGLEPPANKPQACLNAPEPAGNGENGVDDQGPIESPDEPAPQHLPQQQPRMTQQPQQMHSSYGMPQGMDPQQQQQMAYQQSQNYNMMAQRQQTGYQMPQAGIPQHNSHQA